MRRTKEEANLTRERLINASLSVFSRDGFAAAKLEDIAREAKVTRGAIYYHFGSKDQLYKELLRNKFTLFHALFAREIAAEATPLEALRTLMIRILQYLEEDSEYRAINELVLLRTQRAAGLTKAAQAIKYGIRKDRGNFTNLIKKAVDTGQIRPTVNPDDAAIAVIGFINGIISLWLMDTEAFSIKAKAETFVDGFIHGMTT